MAGEWIPIDCNLGTKPEVLELVDETGEPVEVVVYRLIQLWSWAALNTADGQIVTTPRRLAAVAGGNEQFWLAVERVGWIEFVGSTMKILGWDRRFSQAAKARALNCRRQDSFRKRSRNGDALLGCNGAELPQERTGEEKREYKQAAPAPPSEPPAASGSTAKVRVSWSADAGWQGITDTDRQEWFLAFPGAILDQELAKAASWLRANPKRAGRRNWRRFLVNWLQRCQEKGGTVREPSAKAATAPRVDPEFERARAATLAREEARRRAEHSRLDAKSGEVLEARKAAVRHLRMAGG
jgi:hypothetical protein